jgi:hypothetical protein
MIGGPANYSFIVDVGELGVIPDDIPRFVSHQTHCFHLDVDATSAPQVVH